jgi:hypothetical protein
MIKRKKVKKIVKRRKLGAIEIKLSLRYLGDYEQWAAWNLEELSRLYSFQIMKGAIQNPTPRDFRSFCHEMHQSCVMTMRVREHATIH